MPSTTGHHVNASSSSRRGNSQSITLRSCPLLRMITAMNEGSTPAVKTKWAIRMVHEVIGEEKGQNLSPLC
eukprot:scaffold2508_cov93-Skeletonema_marinoi.AAC.8